MKFFNKKNLFFKICLLSVVFYAAGIIYYKQENIYPYNSANGDKQFILDLFKNNWYWLVASDSFSPEHMLDFKASSERPQDSNKVSIFVYKTDGKPVGFVAYYLKNFFKGFIYFLAVDEQHRKKGYARKLLKFAIDNLKKQNVKAIELITRTTNIRAQNLYKSLGFKEIWRDEGFIRYEKEV